MSDSDRHAEVVGGLNRIGQKLDDYIVNSNKILDRHEADIKVVTGDVSVLQHRWSRARGVLIAVTGIAALGAAIAKAKALF